MKIDLNKIIAVTTAMLLTNAAQFAVQHMAKTDLRETIAWAWERAHEEPRCESAEPNAEDLAANQCGGQRCWPGEACVVPGCQCINFLCQ